MIIKHGTRSRRDRLVHPNRWAGRFSLDTRHGIAASRTERRELAIADIAGQCPETRRKCPRIGQNVRKMRTRRAEYRRPTHDTKSSSRSPNAPIIIPAYLQPRFPPSRIDRRKRKRPASLVGGRGDKPKRSRQDFLSLPAPFLCLFWRFSPCSRTSWACRPTRWRSAHRRWRSGGP